MFEIAQVIKNFEIAIKESFSTVELKAKEILVIGCSTSEIQGMDIGTFPSSAIASELMHILMPIIKQANIYLAVQCCEHLNRALVVDKKCVKEYSLPLVTVIPYPYTGGSLCSYYYRLLDTPIEKFTC